MRVERLQPQDMVLSEQRAGELKVKRMGTCASLSVIDGWSWCLEVFLWISELSYMHR